ncbi:MAG: CHAT domain-containing protein [Deltaproteobacteria bacterium]|nr:MAG: CHAT domain-containing protein [Deltaproteobacteria bacterium]
MHIRSELRARRHVVKPPVPSPQPDQSGCYPPPRSPMTKHTILFLAANPLGTDRLALDEEARAIQEELERSGHRDQFELVTRWAVRPLDLLRELRKLKPTIVHFSGHGGRGEAGEPRSGAGARRDIVGEPGAVDGDRQHGLFFQGPDGRPQLVSTAALEQTFGAAGSSVRLVVLNACYSELQAKALLAHVGCVVGMGGSIGDDAARSFAIGFYGGLAAGESIAIAYKQGCAAISVMGLYDSNCPKLIVGDSGKSERLVFPNVIASIQRHERMEKPVEYYIYISDSKINMIIPQIVNSDHGNTGAGLAKLEIDSMGLSSHYRMEREYLAARIADLQTVMTHLRVHNTVGSIGNTPEYIEGIAGLSWGLMHAHFRLADVAFFVGHVGDDLLLLIGSAHHVLGESKGLYVGSVSSYYCARELLSLLDDESQYLDHDKMEWHCTHSLHALMGSKYPKQRLRFFAKRYGKFGVVILGSPIFVSMAE